MSVSDAKATFKGDLLQAADAALDPLVEAIQADSAQQITDLTARAAAAEDAAATLQTQHDLDVQSITGLRQQLATADQALTDLKAASAKALSALQAKYDAYVKAHPDTDPPPADLPLLVGATLRPPSSVTRPRPVWGITRVYNIDDALKVDGLVALSFGSLLGGKGWRSSASKVSALDAALAQVPDAEGQRVGDTHEFDNPSKYGTDSVSYLADAAKFKERVAAANAGRTNPLTVFRCCMAFSLSDQSRHIDDFYLQDPENYDEFGPDVYKLPDIQKVVDTAVRYGKPLCIPEFGPLDNVAHTDPAILDEMQRGIAAWADTAEWVAWFDKKGAGADLDQYPNALAYWGSQV